MITPELSLTPFDLEEGNLEAMKQGLKLLAEEVLKYYDFCIQNKRLTHTVEDGGTEVRIPTDLILQNDCWSDLMQKDPSKWKFKYELAMPNRNMTILHDARSRGSESTRHIATINSKAEEINGVDEILAEIERNNDAAVEKLRSMTVALADLLIKLKQEHEKAKAEHQAANEDLRRLRLAFKVLVDKTLSQETLDEVEKLLKE